MKNLLVAPVPSALTGAAGDELVQQLVEVVLQTADLGSQAVPGTGHGVGVTLRLLALPSR